MVAHARSPQSADIIYPDSNGQPMADNTQQFRWITTIKHNLDWLFAADSNIFIAGDLLWYPVEGRPDITTAPDVLVVFGCPKGDRGSYKQWEEADIAPQVVFEILSPSNTRIRMAEKLLFYERHGVEEYYLYDPDTIYLEGWLRGDSGLEAITSIRGWVSPRLQIRFELSEETLTIYDPAGIPFLSYVEIAQQLEQERQRAEQERQRADEEHQRAEQAMQQVQDMTKLLEQYQAQFGQLPPG
ncbi:MAG: hypothetical protein F6K42_03760 [Leptolyngbya sp. SIO1D8]|nr:hypothetical protein [Leptolyngbya sp. SIO1D8]